MKPELVYDIGMNNGDDTAYYLHRGYRVVGVEANPVLVEQVAARFHSEIASGRLEVLNVGIAETEGDFSFWVCDHISEWSSLDRALAARDNSPHHEINVHCVRFASILEKYGMPYFLKVDIEGADHLCLAALTRETTPPYISVEASNIDLLDVLHALGYDLFQCISQFNFIPLELPPSPLQADYEARMHSGQSLAKFREFAGWQFKQGSSGPFGPDLPGRWQSFDEMKRTYAHFQELQRQGVATPFWNEKGYSFWSDFHATNSARLPST